MLNLITTRRLFSPVETTFRSMLFSTLCYNWHGCITSISISIKFQRWLAVDTNNSLNVYSTWLIYAEIKQCWGFKITSINLPYKTKFQRLFNFGEQTLYVWSIIIHLWRAIQVVVFLIILNLFFKHFYENQICNMLSTFWSVYMYEMLGRIKSNFVKGWGGDCALALLGDMKVCRILCVYSSCMCINSYMIGRGE